MRKLTEFFPLSNTYTLLLYCKKWTILLFWQLNNYERHLLDWIMNDINLVHPVSLFYEQWIILIGIPVLESKNVTRLLPPKAQVRATIYLAFLHNSTFRCIFRSSTLENYWNRLSKLPPCCVLERMECMCKRGGRREVKFEISDSPVWQERWVELSKLASFVPAVFYTPTCFLVSAVPQASSCVTSTVEGFKRPVRVLCFGIEQCILILVWKNVELLLVCVF